MTLDTATIAKHLQVNEQMAEQLAEQMAGIVRFEQKFAELFPNLPAITRAIMAQDFAGAEKAEQKLRAGEITFDTALLYCGSYSRLDFALRMSEAGLAKTSELLDRLVELWPGCDPDDTDERFVQLWRLAFQRNGSYLRDGPALPRGKTLTVYRGQPVGAPLGCAWSLDEKIATKFARGAWARVPVASGEVIKLDVPRSMILAYLTARNESEVIIDPKWLVRTNA